MKYEKMSADIESLTIMKEEKLRTPAREHYYLFYYHKESGG